MSQEHHKTFVPIFNQREQAKKVIETCFNNLRYNEDKDEVKFTKNSKSKTISFYEFYTEITSFGIAVKTRDLKVLLDLKAV